MHEEEADKAQAASDHHRWEAARLIAEELAEGTSQRKLAAKIGKSHTHVRLMKECWEKRKLKLPRESFNEFYNGDKVRNRNRKPGQEQDQKNQEPSSDENRQRCPKCNRLMPKKRKRS